VSNFPCSGKDEGNSTVQVAECQGPDGKVKDKK
jgi:hypothetical protein